MKKQVLIVDDDQSFCRMLQATLLIFDCAVTVCQSGEAAMSHLSIQKFDHVVTDFDLGPGRMTGYQLMIQIKERFASPPKVSLMSANLPPGIDLRHFTPPKLLLKPFDMSALRKAIAA